jgi:DNA polymerase-3 subunit gamma/tau
MLDSISNPRDGIFAQERLGMATQALYLRWRPMTFEDVVGQEHVTYTLRNALVSGRVGHAYLFSGPRGTGKTTMARLLAKAVNCLHDDPAIRPCNECRHCQAVNEGRFLDLIEIDAASHTGVDDVRELRERIAFAPNEGQYKVYIIDEVHRFSGAAFDALLKTIEEPPAHAIFVLATTEIHKVPQTIQSRCQRFDFRRIALGQIVERLNLIIAHEGIQAEPQALELVARQATGSLRDAISLLDQLISEPGEVLTLQLAQGVLGTADSQAVSDLTGALILGDAAGGLEIINAAMDHGTDTRQFANQMLDHLRRVMLVQTGGRDLVAVEVMPDQLEIIMQHAEQLPRRALLQAMDLFREAAADTKGGGWQPQLPLEMAFVESVQALYAAPGDVAPAAPPPVAPAPAQTAPAAPQNVMSPQVAPRAAPAPQEQAAAQDESAPPVIPITQIHAHWNQVLSVSRQIEPTGMVQALLRTGGVYGVEGHTVILQMPGDVLCAKIEDEANRAVIEAALERVFNQHLNVRCRVSAGPAPEQQSSEVDDLMASDSLISYAVNELGGTVKNVEPNEDEEQAS